MNVLVFGQSGQVASELQHIGIVRALSRQEADLSNYETCVQAIEKTRPSAVINAAAYTAVDRAEGEEAQAFRINGAAPTAMAEVCARLQIPFVHISTDYVFDGTGHLPWKAADAPFPQNAYGRSKLAGERGIVAAGGTFAIVRTSWVFSAHGTNFVKTMLRLSETRHSLGVVSDQIGGPTPARAIAAACLEIAAQLKKNPERSGIYHLTGGPDVSWYDFAAEIFKRARRTIALTPLPTSAYPTPALRPLNSRMECSATTTAFGLPRPDWRDGLDDVLKELDIIQ